MPPTAIYLYPPSATYGVLADKMSGELPSLRPSPNPPWMLSHQLWRGTTDPAQPPPAAPADQAHLQVIRVSPHANRFVHTTPAQASSAEPTTVKLPMNTNFAALLNTKLALLWSPARQYNLEVQDGQTWDIGVVEIRVGEIQGPLPGSTGTSQRVHRGTVVIVRLVEEGGWKAGEGSKFTSGNESQNQANGGEREQFTEEERLQIQETIKMIGDGPGPNLTPAHEFWGSFDDWKSEIALWSEVLRHPSLSGAIRR